jgi:hypothetical protein|tara:strand:- start:57 stop:230 length:174 start_codon:yes stop_codon:yes gene_type:complete
MDIEKWKSVLVPIEVYKGIKAIAQHENRTISGQLRVMFTKFCETEKIKVNGIEPPKR